MNDQIYASNNHGSLYATLGLARPLSDRSSNFGFLALPAIAFDLKSCWLSDSQFCCRTAGEIGFLDRVQTMLCNRDIFSGDA